MECPVQVFFASLPSEPSSDTSCKVALNDSIS
jgi:hypothetical protein